MRDCSDLTPEQLAAFYRAVGGNYDVLFIETQPSSISFIYKALGCLHSIQPKDESDGHAIPSIPALKPKGFVAWQTIQLLLGPEEHVPFLQNAVAQFDILNPKTGEKFPKVLPDEAFPKDPDPAMLEWYDQVHDKLQQDLQNSPDVGRRSLSLSDASLSEQSGDERFAATYFRNPMFRDNTGRPTVTVTRGSYKPPRMRATRQPSIADRGKAIVNNVRHFISPPSTSHHHSAQRHGRRGSHTDRFREDDESEEYEDLTPTGLHPEFRSRPPLQQQRPRPKSPELIDTDSDSDSVHVLKRPTVTRRTSSRDQRERELRERNIQRDMDQKRRDRERERERDSYREREREREREYERDSPVSSKHDSKSPPLRHRRSHEPQVSPIGYFQRPFFEDEVQRRHSHAHDSYAGNALEVGGFAPSNEPSMASRVAKMQHSSRTNSPNPRVSGGSAYAPPRSVPPPVEERSGSYNGRPTVRYSRRSIDEDRKRDRDRERERPRYERSSEGGSRGSDEYLGEPSPRMDLGGAGGRSRSNDKWDADRLRQSTRYVEGAGGRRYPSSVPWH